MIPDNMEHRKILIIDDDVSIRKTLFDILRIKGYDPLTAGSGEEGLRALAGFPADLAIIDLGLPDMSGIEVLGKLKADHPSTEAIILTGNASLDTAIEATNTGAFSYLLKPYDMDQLMLHILRALEKQRARETIARHNMELQRMNAELKALYEVSLAISRTTDMDGLFSEILHVLAQMEILRIEPKGAVFLVEEDRMRLVSRIGFVQAEQGSCEGLRPGECLCGLAAETGEVIISRNSREDSRHTGTGPEITPHGHIVVPLKTVNKVIGVLCLYTHADIEIGEGLVNVLVSMGNQIGIAVENAKLYAGTKFSSLHDSLTGLANRRFLEIQLEKSFESEKRYRGELSAIMLDIDHFKQYNDTYGHVQGDRLLVTIANILSNSVRDADYAFRYGGEEFLILLPGIDLEMGCKAAQRLRITVEAKTGVTISLGVASMNESMKDKEELIAGSDKALYLAKQRGRNRVEVNGQ
jgi:diguanylate cyclase (GGDEF)-like protein